MKAGPGAWWCFMGYQKASLREAGITRTLLALLWSGKRHVNQPGLAGDSGGGSMLALVHLPCYAWAEAGVILPPISFCSFEILFMAHLIIIQHHLPASFDTREWYHRCHHGEGSWKTALSILTGNGHWVSKLDIFFCTWNSFVLFWSRANPFVEAVTHLSKLLMDWMTLGLLLPHQRTPKTTKHSFCQFAECHACFMLQNVTNHFVDQTVYRISNTL